MAGILGLALPHPGNTSSDLFPFPLWLQSELLVTLTFSRRSVESGGDRRHEPRAHRLPLAVALVVGAPKLLERLVHLVAHERHAARGRLDPRLQIERGDILRIVGAKRHVEAAVKLLGFPDRPTNATDMAFVGWGIVLGGLVGIPAVVLAGVEIGLSLSVGVLLGGLVFGWLRSVQPRFGSIPEPALWLFESVGLAGFAAVVGISAGPDFVAGLERAGVWIVVAAAAIVVIAQTCAIFVGHRVFKMHPGVLLGVCAAAFTATPALAAIQEQAKSSVPTLGYGVSYAVGNVLLALWGTVIVALLA